MDCRELSHFAGGSIFRSVIADSVLVLGTSCDQFIVRRPAGVAQRPAAAPHVPHVWQEVRPVAEFAGAELGPAVAALRCLGFDGSEDRESGRTVYVCHALEDVQLSEP